MNSITRKTFEHMDTDSKLNVLFDYAVDTHARLKKLESRKRFDSVLSGMMGIIGGFCAMLGIKIFK